MAYQRPDNNETVLKTFNTAKLFTEGLLFPLMKQFTDFRTQSDFGWREMDKAVEMTEEMRDLQRYNGLKGMAETAYNLCLAITSTVRVHNNREENKMLDSLTKYLENLKKVFYEHREQFFGQSYREGHVVDVLERQKFEKVKKDVNDCYINIEILMTRNKLLFADMSDEYLNDKEILEQLKQEYVEG